MSSTTVQVSGTSKTPLEDLSSRVEAALKQHEIDSALPPASSYPTIPLAPGAKKKAIEKDAAKKSAEDAFKKLIEP